MFAGALKKNVENGKAKSKYIMHPKTCDFRQVSVMHQLSAGNHSENYG
jgi:hypothetical protein